MGGEIEKEEGRVEEVVVLSPELGGNDYQLFLLSLAVCNTGLEKYLYIYLEDIYKIII